MEEEEEDFDDVDEDNSADVHDVTVQYYACWNTWIMDSGAID